MEVIESHTNRTYFIYDWSDQFTTNAIILEWNRFI